MLYFHYRGTALENAVGFISPPDVLTISSPTLFISSNPTSRFVGDRAWGLVGGEVSGCVVGTRTCWNGRWWIKHVCSFWFALPLCCCAPLYSVCVFARVLWCVHLHVCPCVPTWDVPYQWGPFAQDLCWVALIFNTSSPHLLSLAGDTLLCHSLRVLPHFHWIFLPTLSLLPSLCPSISPQPSLPSFLILLLHVTVFPFLNPRLFFLNGGTKPGFFGRLLGYLAGLGTVWSKVGLWVYVSVSKTERKTSGRVTGMIWLLWWLN